MKVWAAEEMLNAVADRFVEFPTGGTRPPDIQFRFQGAETAGLHEIQRPEGPSRPFYQTPLGEAAYFPSQDVYYIEYGLRARTWFHPMSGECRFSILEPQCDQAWIATHPLLTIALLELLKRRGKYGIHAAGVARNGRSILLPGNSGAGKSTLTIALLRAGFELLGDDLAFLEVDDGLRSLAFPEEIAVTDETLSLFPELQALDRPYKSHGSPKYQLRAQDIYSSVVAWRSVPAAIVFPVIADQCQSSLLPVSADEAFLQLSATVLLTEMESTRAQIGVLADFAKTVPAYRLLTGRDFDQVASLLGGLVA